MPRKIVTRRGGVPERRRRRPERRKRGAGGWWRRRHSHAGKSATIGCRRCRCGVLVEIQGHDGGGIGAQRTCKTKPSKRIDLTILKFRNCSLSRSLALSLSRSLGKRISQGQGRTHFRIETLLSCCPIRKTMRMIDMRRAMPCIPTLRRRRLLPHHHLRFRRRPLLLLLLHLPPGRRDPARGKKLRMRGRGPDLEERRERN